MSSLAGYALCQMSSDTEDEPCLPAESCPPGDVGDSVTAATMQEQQAPRDVPRTVTVEDAVDFVAAFGAADTAESDADWSRGCGALDGALQTCCSRGLDKLERLEDELMMAQQELKLKDQQVTKLSLIRDDIESEMEDLTASLFQEAHKMVLAANEKQAAAEKSLQEATMKIDVLQAEVAALKTMVLTSTPSRPNARLHPHIEVGKSNGMGLFKRGHRRTPSNQELGGADTSPPGSPTRSSSVESRLSELAAATSVPVHLTEPRLMEAVARWRDAPTLDLKEDPFLSEVHRIDITPCLQFSAVQLSDRVERAVLDNAVFIEAVQRRRTDSHHLRDVTTDIRDDDESTAAVESECGLLGAGLPCTHRLKLPDDTDWTPISQICRNRVTAVCDFLNYLRYIQQGLVKAAPDDVYRRIMELRRGMALARLGFSV